MAARVKNDRLAKKLLQNGNRFGRQHVVFQARHSYPAYVVKYSLDDATAKLSVVKVQSSAQSISVTVAGKTVYKANPRELKHSFVFVSVHVSTLNHGKATIFDIRDVKSVAESMTAYLASLTPNEIVVVAAPKLPLQGKVSPIMVDVLRSLHSIGGSLHFLECPYVLVGSKQPYLLTGLVHEDHQPTEAAIEVDLRVIRYNLKSPIIPIAQRHSVTDADMTPVRWQQQDKRNPNGVAWEELRVVGPQLSAAYQTNDEHVVINGHTVDLVKMKVLGGPKIRCLNLKGETLAPLTRIKKQIRSHTI